MLSSSALCGFVSTEACRRSKFASDGGPRNASCLAELHVLLQGALVEDELLLQGVDLLPSFAFSDFASASPWTQPIVSRNGPRRGRRRPRTGRRMPAAVPWTPSSALERNETVIRTSESGNQAAHDDPALEGTGATRGVAGGGGALDGVAQDREADGPVARHRPTQSSGGALRSRSARPGTGGARWAGAAAASPPPA